MNYLAGNEPHTRATLVAQWKAAGGSEALPTIQEHLKANNRPPHKPKASIRY